MTPRLHDLLKWYKLEFIRRTLAVKRDECPIDWVPVGTRVSWTEIVTRAEHMGIDLDNLADARRLWHDQRNWETWTNRIDRMPSEKLAALLDIGNV